ncbi:larval/pupal cuticle protein H1C-like [Diorhabda sublineata]|uniref:larval/pupal cuticle protein H1C-like n=1 Tax=Diorhabda sublineata TaxID=1163346 RepID=UPI0024E0EC1D|nr:larval/pupal cuticle protein H1C-like [Diorhabda sublineata]
MFKLLVLAVLLCTVNAGIILDHKPVIAVAHTATSHQNSNSLSINPVPIVAHKVAVAHAPVAIAHAPIAVAHAPIAVAHAPVAVAHHSVAVAHHPVAVLHH